jgi:carbon monoxide dehydrogenase subunit G
MTSIRKEIQINAPAAEVWAALRDVGALHTKLCPGFVTDTKLEGHSRLVTFGNGTKVREDIVSIDDARRCLIWAIVGQQFHHYQGSARVRPDGNGNGTHFTWSADLLPDEMAGDVEQMMNAGIEIIRQTLESRRA